MLHRTQNLPLHADASSTPGVDLPDANIDHTDLVEQRFAIAFGGQGAQWWPALQQLSQNISARPWLELAHKILQDAEEQDSSVYAHGVNFVS